MAIYGNPAFRGRLRQRASGDPEEDPDIERKVMELYGRGIVDRGALRVGPTSQFVADFRHSQTFISGMWKTQTFADFRE